MKKLPHKLAKHYHYHKNFIPHYFVVVFYTAIAVFALYSFFPPKIQAAEEQPIQKLDQPIQISLWGWIRTDSLSVSSNYDTPLTASIPSGFYPFKRQLLVEPSDLLYPNAEYELKIEAKNWFGLKTTKVVKVRTTALPEVSLANKFPDKTQIAANTKFQFNLGNSLAAENFNFVANPSFDYDKKLENNILVVSPKSKLRQGTVYSLSISLKSKTLGDSVLYQENLAVINALDLSSNPAHNTELVPKQSQLEFIFNKEPIAEGIEKLIKTEPEINYNLTWKDPRTLVLTPVDQLQTNTKYIISFADSLSGKDGSSLAETKTITFTTAGPVKVVNFSPTGSSASTLASINVAFDQPVDQSSAQRNFSINPAVGGSFSWAGNTLVFKPQTALAPLVTYTISVATGIKSIGGEDSTQTFSGSFTTTSERVRTIGYSVRKRAISAYYFGNGPKKILLIGTMHGNEGNTGNMLNSWISYIRANQKDIGTDRTFIIVPFANPDGRSSNNRFNANNVDLNRNFDLPDWQALTYWQNRSYPTGGGSAPFSEPESRALRDLVLSENPSLSISYHSNANLVLGDGIAQAFGDWYSNLTGYTRSQSSGQESDVSALGYVITGTYEEWATKRGVKTLVIEFISQTANEYSRNLPALRDLLTYPI